MTSIDPIISGLRFTVHTHVYDPIIQWDAKAGAYKPMLAESWERIDDDETVRFHLRPDVKFHNGSPFGAEDVKFYLDRVKDPDVGSPSAGWYDAIEEIKVVDDLTIDVIGKPLRRTAHNEHPRPRRQRDL